MADSNAKKKKLSRNSNEHKPLPLEVAQEFSALLGDYVRLLTEALNKCEAESVETLQCKNFLQTTQSFEKLVSFANNIAGTAATAGLVERTDALKERAIRLDYDFAIAKLRAEEERRNLEESKREVKARTRELKNQDGS